MGAQTTNRPSPEELHAYAEGTSSPPVALPADLVWVSLTETEASTYLDLRIHRSDFDFAVAVLTRLVEAQGSGEFRTDDRDPERDDQRARWNAALVAYARPFVSGIGQRLTLSIIESASIEDHTYFMNLRHRHVAHSVSEYEQVGVVIALSRDNPTTVVGLLDSVTTEQLPGESGVRRFLRLAEAARDEVETRLEVERARLLHYARMQAADLAKREPVTFLPKSRYDDNVKPRRSRPR